MLDAGPAQPDQVDAPRAVSLEDLARGGDTRSAPSAECAASSVTAAPGLQQLRSYGLHLLVSDRAAYSGHPHDRRAGNCYPLASRRLPLLLALEIASTCRQAERCAGNPAADPGDEPRQSALGRSAHPWRAPQARHRRRPDLRCEVYGAAKATPSQGWRTFLRNHLDGVASIDLFVVPTISFKLLYGLLILRHDRRRILWVGVTPSPTADWIARQVSEACGWEPVPDYLVRDRDRVYGEAYTRRIRAMGIRDRPTAPRSPWQNGYAERLIGSIRRECLDHVIVFG